MSRSPQTGRHPEPVAMKSGMVRPCFRDAYSGQFRENIPPG
jgi:hypothetical protein